MNHEIQISITTDQHGNANFSYSFAALHVYPADGDTVTWSSIQGPFAIQFLDRTPGHIMDLRGKGNPSAGWATDPFTPRDHMHGAYHYSVAIEMGGFIYMDATCPVLIFN